MTARRRFLSPMLALLAAGIFCGNSISVYASGGTEGAAAKQPVPDREKKVFTNDDLEAKFGKPSIARETRSSQAISASAQTSPAAPPASSGSTARPERLAPEKDPLWYARQAESFGDELASVDMEAQRFLQFRTPGNTPRAGTGLILNAPCEGLTTDNRISQLLARRQEIEAQMSELEDTARRNDMPPGLFVEAPTIAAASGHTSPPTAAERRAALENKLGQLSDQLEATQAVIAEMGSDAAVRRMTLLRPNGYGANMTTDLLQRLGAQSTLLQGEISTATDDALRAGLPARDLP
jgi:hypothetical protein